MLGFELKKSMGDSPRCPLQGSGNLESVPGRCGLTGNYLCTRAMLIARLKNMPRNFAIGDLYQQRFAVIDH